MLPIGKSDVGGGLQVYFETDEREVLFTTSHRILANSKSSANIFYIVEGLNERLDKHANE